MNDDHAEAPAREFIDQHVEEICRAADEQIAREVYDILWTPEGYHGHLGLPRISAEELERLKQPPSEDGPRYLCAVAPEPVPAPNAHPLGNRKQRLARAAQGRREAKRRAAPGELVVRTVDALLEEREGLLKDLEEAQRRAG